MVSRNPRFYSWSSLISALDHVKKIFLLQELPLLLALEDLAVLGLPIYEGLLLFLKLAEQLFLFLLQLRFQTLDQLVVIDGDPFIVFRDLLHVRESVVVALDVRELLLEDLVLLLLHHYGLVSLRSSGDYVVHHSNDSYLLYYSFLITYVAPLVPEADRQGHQRKRLEPDQPR